MALLLLPIPVRIVNTNVREVLMMTSTDEVLVGRVEGVISQISAEHDIRSHSSHIVKIGRMHLIEINLVVGPGFEPQRVADLDRLRERVWAAMDRPLDEAWLSICFTADPRWSWRAHALDTAASDTIRRLVGPAPNPRRCAHGPSC